MYICQVDLALVSKTCNMYKVRPDMTDSWLSLLDLMKYFGDNAQRYANYSGPGSYLLTSEVKPGNKNISTHLSTVLVHQIVIPISLTGAGSWQRFQEQGSRNLFPNSENVLLQSEGVGGPQL